jgi:hypothetical protein
MTESEWLNATEPGEMIRWYKGGMSQRKFRLFIVACCRSLWDELTPKAARGAIDILEDHADGNASVQKLQDARTIVEEEAARLWEILYGTSGGGWRNSLYTQAQALGCATQAAFYDRIAPQHWAGCRDLRPQYQCQLLRDIFGIPHRLMWIDPAWIAQANALVPGVARAAYDERRFEDLPILADALEESGCTDQDVLSHLRGNGPHTRGCWALDFLLNKA